MRRSVKTEEGGRYVRKMRSAPFASGVATIATGSALAQAIPILLTPVLTRLYSSDDMGILGLYTAFIGFVAHAITMGYSQAIVSGRTGREAADLALLSALFVLPMSVLGACLLLFFSWQGWLGFGALPLWSSGAMALSLLLTGLYLTVRYWLVRVGAYRDISIAIVAQSLGRVVTQLLSGVLGLGGTGLVLGEVIGRAFGLRRMWTTAERDLRAGARGVTLRRVGMTAVHFRKFPLISAPSSVLNSLSLVLPVPMISLFFGLHAAGQYAVASRIMILPLALIGSSVGDVFHSRLAGLSRQHPERAFSLFARIVMILFGLAAPPMLLIRYAGERLFGYVLGGDWSTAGEIASVITPWILMQFVVSPVSRLVQVYQGQEVKLVYDFLALLSIGGVLILGDRREWSIVQTCTLLGWSQALVYGVYLVLLVRVLRKNQMVNQERAGDAFDGS